MHIFKKTAVILVTGCLMAGASLPARANVPNATRSGGLTFVPLTPEAAAKLPPWLKPSDVVGMSVETAPIAGNSAAATDLAVTENKEQAQAWVNEVGRHLRHAKRSSFYSSQGETEYRDGVKAFMQGRYSEAIDHLRTADSFVSGIPNSRVDVG
jgi:TolA-binding protein